MITVRPLVGEQAVGCTSCSVKWQGEIDSPCWMCGAPGVSVWATKALASSPVGEYRSGGNDG